MKKIPTIFIRNPKNRKELLNEQHPDCDWVFAGEGAATRKYDGTCCMIKENNFYKRREIKPNKKIPKDFIEVQFDKITGKRVGWVPVNCNDPNDKWHCSAFINQPDGTYELCGPKIQGNPEGFKKHILIPHMQAEQYKNFPLTKEEIFKWFQGKDIEGIVFHHPDGRMAKIKLRDFGLKRQKEKP